MLRQLHQFAVVRRASQCLDARAQIAEPTFLPIIPIRLFRQFGRLCITVEECVTVADWIRDVFEERTIAVFRHIEVRQAGREHRGAGSRARNRRAQHRQGRPITHPLLVLAAAVVGHHRAGELEELVEPGCVGAAERVTHFDCVTERERPFSPQPLQHITAFALDEVFGDGAPLGVCGCCQINRGVFGSEELEQGLEFFGLAAVRRGSQQHEMLLWLFGETRQ